MPVEDTLFPPTVPTDIRLIASDLDGTLLNGEGKIPDEFWPLLAELTERGILFAVASGRQYPTVKALFAGWEDQVAFVAENGSMVMDRGQFVGSSPLSDADDIIKELRKVSTEEEPLGILKCTREAALVERDEPEFLEGAGQFFLALDVVPDIVDVDDEVLKISIYDDSDRGEKLAEAIKPLVAPNIAVASSDRWIDITRPDVNKGVALASLQERIGVSPEQTLVFGDYLNDIELIQSAEHSFAVANAHEDVKELARYQTTANTEGGVVTALKWLLDS